MAKLAIDLHGGDFGPSVLIPSCLQFFREFPQHHGVLVGDSRVCRPYAQSCPANIEWVDADAIGDIAQKPSRLLRQEGHSSIEICYRALANNDVDAVVSAEHTGVLLVLMSKYGQLHSLLSRPVLASWLPTLKKPTVMLDLGASFTASQEQLLAYSAVGMGIMAPKADKPSLALLNVGTEYFKGPPELRLADATLAQWSNLDYRGFVEASEVFHGELDIIVSDGFTGNSVIKSAEGAMDLTVNLMRNSLSNGWVSKFFAFWLRQKLKNAMKSLDPRYANGALVAGSNLLVIKSHGNARHKAFRSALLRATEAHGHHYTSSIWAQLDSLYDDII